MSFLSELTRFRHQRDDLTRAPNQTVDAGRTLFIQGEHSTDPVPPSGWAALRTFTRRHGRRRAGGRPGMPPCLNGWPPSPRPRCAA